MSWEYSVAFKCTEFVDKDNTGYPQ